MLKSKLSMDLDSDNVNIINQLRENYNKKFSPLMNYLIHLLGTLPDEVRSPLIKYCIDSAKSIDAKASLEPNSMFASKLSVEKEYFLELARLFNKGRVYEYQAPEPGMASYAMKDATLKVPKEWIILNPEEASECRYAGVVECFRGSRFNIPHFVFFTNRSSTLEYWPDGDMSFQKHIEDLCEEKWPKFKDIRNMQVELVTDPETGKIINSDELYEAPTIGLFELQRDDDPDFRPNPPCGAFIKTKGYTYARLSRYAELISALNEK